MVCGFHFCLLRRLYMYDVNKHAINQFFLFNPPPLYEHIEIRSLSENLWKYSLWMIIPFSSYLLFKIIFVISDMYIATCIIQNSRIIQDAWFGFISMQLPWLEYRTNLIYYILNFIHILLNIKIYLSLFLLLVMNRLNSEFN